MSYELELPLSKGKTPFFSPWDVPFCLDPFSIVLLFPLLRGSLLYWGHCSVYLLPSRGHLSVATRSLLSIIPVLASLGFRLPLPLYIADALTLYRDLFVFLGSLLH